MENNKKIKYEAPALEVMLIELEQGIAAASATLGGNDDTGGFQPEVEDWQDSGIGNQNGDL